GRPVADFRGARVDQQYRYERRYSPSITAERRVLYEHRQAADCKSPDCGAHFHGYVNVIVLASLKDDLSDLAGAFFGEPEVAIRTGCDEKWSALTRGNCEFSNGSRWS